MNGALVSEILNWLLEIAKIAIPAFVTIATYRKMTNEQNPKLDNIEKATNGNLEKKDKEIERLEGQVRSMGGDPR